MRNFRPARLLALSAVVLPLLASCGGNVKINGTLTDAPSSEVIVKLLDVNQFQVLDTVAVDAEGRFSYEMDIEKGQPEFVYLFYKDTKVASLLLQKGDKVKVTADTLGSYTVKGSSESEKLAEVEKDFSEFSASFEAYMDRLDEATGSPDADRLAKEMGQLYTDYYRSRVKYVILNPYSLTVVPVLFQVAGEALPVFSQDTDAIHFRNAADSLATVLPDSKYVRALRAEADRRVRLLEIRMRLRSADELDFPEIELPDVNAQKIKLSEVDAKVVMLRFWTCTNTAQKMYNQDVLKPIYEEFHDRGLEIYQVSLDTDKSVWARTVKDQELNWINVCDALGANSTAARMYNVYDLPVTYYISGGQLLDSQPTDAASIRKLLNNLL